MSPGKHFTRYLPLGVTVLLILSPHPSLLIVLINYHLRVLHAPFTFAIHLVITYTLTCLAFSSLTVCVNRDPGRATLGDIDDSEEHVGEEIELRQALMSHNASQESIPIPGRWCHTCVAPKPERAHHCSQCGRCVLKMDHHCPWLGSSCIGHRNYPAFLHFLCSITLLSIYIAVISICALSFAFNNALSIPDESVPVHELFLAFAGLTFALVIGSFFLYHVYLVSINETTYENITQFHLLRHLPPLPPSPTGQKLSNPPLEHELTFRQRCLVREARHVIRLYNVGFRRNWSQVMGWEGEWGWVQRLLFGGSSQGDGRKFPRNPQSDAMLAKLARELVKIDLE